MQKTTHCGTRWAPTESWSLLPNDEEILAGFEEVKFYIFHPECCPGTRLYRKSAVIKGEEKNMRRVFEDDFLTYWKPRILDATPPMKGVSLERLPLQSEYTKRISRNTANVYQRVLKRH